MLIFKTFQKLLMKKIDEYSFKKFFFCCVQFVKRLIGFKG